MQTRPRPRPALDQEQLRRFHADGFLVLPALLTRAELQPVLDEIAALVDDVALRLQRTGRLRDLHRDLGFYERLTAIDRDCPGVAVLVHINGVLGPALAQLWASPRLLDVAEALLGPEIAGHPVWNIRSKTPLNPLATVPWHQDTAYMAAGCEDTLQPAAWIPLIDATAELGTLQVVRGGHRHGVLRHRPEREHGDARSWYLRIDEADLPPGEIVTCEIPLGSVLLLHQLIPHRSTENRSDRIRWSIDLRWQRPGEPHGYEGIKDPIPMRTAAHPAYRPDWEAWARQNRIAGAMADTPRDEFDTTVTGPWLERWK